MPRNPWVSLIIVPKDFLQLSTPVDGVDHGLLAVEDVSGDMNGAVAEVDRSAGEVFVGSDLQ